MKQKASYGLNYNIFIIYYCLKVGSRNFGNIFLSINLV